MKQLVKNYTFSKTAKTITFTDFSAIIQERILLITDVTNGTILYQFNSAGLGGTVATNVLTLALNTNTGSFNNTDKLQIFYENATGDPVYDSPVVVGNVASGSTDSGAPVKVGGKYNSSGVTLADGQRGDLQLDGGARLKVTLDTLISGEDLTNGVMGTVLKPALGSQYTTGSYQKFGSTDALVKGNIKSAAGNLYVIRATNKNASAARYLMIFNASGTPSEGATPIDTWQIPAGTSLQPGSITVGPNYFAPSEYCSSGIAWAISTQLGTLSSTGTTAAEHDVSGRYL